MFRNKAHNSFAGINQALTEGLHTFPFLDDSELDETLLRPHKERRQIEAGSYLITVLMSLFFEITIAYTSRTTPKARREADAFLQSLFDELMHCVDDRLDPKSSESSRIIYSRALKILLEKSVKHCVQLDIATLESILERASGLFNNDGGQQVEWDIIRLCLENNADVFIVPTGVSSGPYSYRKSNEALNSLLAILDTSSDNLSSNSSQLYSLKLNRILIPLLLAFASARDLTGFLEHWKEQLDVRQKADKLHSSSELMESVHQTLWEDDTFLLAAQELIESCLSMDQVKVIIEKIELSLRTLDKDDSEPFKASDLVILDCIFGGCHTEEFQARLSKQARSVYEALASAFLKSSQIYGNYRWRLWRIFTSINQKWARYESGSLITDRSQQVAETAFATLDAPGNETNADHVNDFQEQSFAFSMIISLAWFDYTWTETPVFLINKSVRRILDLKAGFCHQLTKDPFRVLTPMQNTQEWNGKANGTKSLDTLYLSCIAQLITQPLILHLVEASTQQRLLEQLSQLARYERHSRDPSNTVINYSWLWNCAQCCEAAYEQGSFAANLRRLQYERFASLLTSQDPLCWEVDSAEYAMALESLSDAPPVHFSSEQVTDIVNNMLDVVLRKKHLGLSNIARHLQILVKFADTPGKSREHMKIFQNIGVDDGTLQEGFVILMLAEIVARETWSAEKAACNDALRRLTHTVMRYITVPFECKVFAADLYRYIYATLELESSAKYFTLFYHWIGREMEQASTNASKSPSGWTLDSPMLLVTSTALNYFHENRQQATRVTNPNGQIVDSVRQQHFKRILNLCSPELHDWRLPSDRNRLAAILECLYGYQDLLLAYLEILQSKFF